MYLFWGPRAFVWLQGMPGCATNLGARGCYSERQPANTSEPEVGTQFVKLALESAMGHALHALRLGGLYAALVLPVLHKLVHKGLTLCSGSNESRQIGVRTMCSWTLGLPAQLRNFCCATSPAPLCQLQCAARRSIGPCV